MAAAIFDWPEPVAFSWESQAEQYPRRQSPGFHHTVENVNDDADHPIDCLLYYDEKRVLRGILNRYPRGVPPYEVPMAINIWVHPARQRQGIGKALVAEAERMWGPVRWEVQRFTRSGAALAAAYRTAEK